MPKSIVARTCFTLRAALACAVLATTLAQGAAADTSNDRVSAEELSALRAALVEAANTNDVEKVIPFLSRDVVVTWQNGDVSRGHDGVRAYFARMLKGKDHLLSGFTVDAAFDGEPVASSPFYAIVSGTSNEEYRLASGTGFTLRGRWTATVVREDGRWVVGSLHTSTGILANPIVYKMKQLMYLLGVIMLVLITAIGVILIRLPTMRRRAAAGAA